MGGQLKTEIFNRITLSGDDGQEIRVEQVGSDFAITSTAQINLTVPMSVFAEWLATLTSFISFVPAQPAKGKSLPERVPDGGRKATPMKVPSPPWTSEDELIVSNILALPDGSIKDAAKAVNRTEASVEVRRRKPHMVKLIAQARNAQA